MCPQRMCTLRSGAPATDRHGRSAAAQGSAAGHEQLGCGAGSGRSWQPVRRAIAPPTSCRCAAAPPNRRHPLRRKVRRRNRHGASRLRQARGSPETATVCRASYASFVRFSDHPAFATGLERGKIVPSPVGACLRKKSLLSLSQARTAPVRCSFREPIGQVATGVCSEADLPEPIQAFSRSRLSEPLRTKLYFFRQKPHPFGKICRAPWFQCEMKMHAMIPLWRAGADRTMLISGPLFYCGMKMQVMVPLWRAGPTGRC